LQENDMWSEDLKGWWQMAVVFAAGFAVLFVVAVVAGSVWLILRGRRRPESGGGV